MPFISIIIPVYNNKVSDIQRCFDSILAQSYSDYEVIVVNDGSEDWCADYLNEFVKYHDRFSILNQENQGVSVARNNGVDVARGEYITFVDADDVISPSFLSVFSERLLIKKDDVLYGLVKYVSKDSQKNLEEEFATADVNPKFYPIDKKLLYSHMIDSRCDEFKNNVGGYLARGCYAKLVRRDLALKVNFDGCLRISEDAIWNLNIIKNADTLTFCRCIVYLYICNENSAIKGYHKDQIEKYELFLHTLWSYIHLEDLKVNYLLKTMEALRELADSYFFNDGRCFFIKCWTFYKLIEYKPWSNAFRLKYAVRLNKKDFVKYLLFRSGLFYPLYWFLKKGLKGK